MSGAGASVVTVTLNPALDQTLDCPGFAAGAVNRVVSQVVHAGGKGINVAAFLAGRGWGEGGAPGGVEVTASGFLGADNAAPFEALFAARGIRDRCLRLPGASRVNVKVVDGPGRAVTDINLPGLAVSAEALRQLTAELEALAERPAAGQKRWFVLAGSVPSGVPDEIYGDLARRLRARGARVAVDASGAPLRHAVAAGADFIKPNVHELGELLGKPVEGRAAVLRAARELERSGIGLVAVSMGAEGAIFVGGAGGGGGGGGGSGGGSGGGGRGAGEEVVALLATPPPVEVASTVGAGDALVAGVIAARLAGGDLEACARTGTAFAVGTLSRIGPTLPSEERLAAIAAAVQIEPLALA